MSLRIRDRVRRFVRGEMRTQGDHYVIVPGPWRARIHRHKYWRWHGIRRVTCAIQRPSPTRSHRWGAGPFRITVSPAVGHARRRT